MSHANNNNTDDDHVEIAIENLTDLNVPREPILSLDLPRYGTRLKRTMVHRNRLATYSELIEGSVSKLNKKDENYHELTSYYEDLKSLTEKQDAALQTIIDADGRPSRLSIDLDALQRLRNRTLGNKVVYIAVFTSLFFNFILTAIKLIAAVRTGSLTLMTSTIDSALDIFSGLVLFFSARAQKVQKVKDRFNYPYGRKKSEAVGIVVFAAVMAAFAVQMIINSVESLVHGKDKPLHIGVFTIVVMSIAIATKLFLFIFCYILNKKHPSDTIAAIALDHINDMCSNTAALIFSVVSSKYYNKCWWLDATGSITISTYIIFIWSKNALDQIRVILGLRAPQEIINMITFVASHYDEAIQFVSYVQAVHFGMTYIVELHIGVNPDMKIDEWHKISRGLTKTLESMAEIDRAFVHANTDPLYRASLEHKSLFE